MKKNLRVFVTAGLLAMGAGLGCAHTPELERQLDLARRQIQDGQADSAIYNLQALPNSDKVQVLLGQAYEAKGRQYYTQSLEQYQAALKLAPDNPAARLGLGQVYFQQSRYEETIDVLEPLIARPQTESKPAALRLLALSYWKSGQLGQAELYLERLKEFQPQDAEYYLGLISEEKGLYEEALEHYDEVLKVSQETVYAGLAKQHIVSIQAKGLTDGLQEIKDTEIRDMIAQAPGAKDYPEAGAVVLLDEERYSIHPDNTMTIRIHRLVKVLNERGRSFGEIKLNYDSSYQTVNVDLAQTILENGHVIQVGKKSMRDLAPWSGFPLYSNAKVKVISMPEVVSGSIIEYRATITSTKLLNKDDFEVSVGIQGYEPCLLQRLELDVPEGQPLNIHYVRLDGVTPQIAQTAGRKIYTWEIKNTPEMIPEPMMPPWADISPFILASSFSSWEEIGNWFNDMAKDQLQADEAIRAEVARLVQGAQTPQEKTTRIFNYMTKEIRYVGLEYGTSGYKPHKAAEIFQNKYGDCKDQASLLVTMLKEAGVPAYLVLLGTRGGGKLVKEIPMIQFNHCIAAAQIDGKLVWLDPTCETCTYGEIPDSDQECQALVIFDSGPKFVETPLIQPEMNKMTKNILLELQTDGSIEGSTEMAAVGTYSISYRGLRYTKPIKRKHMLQGLVSDTYPGGKLLDYNIEGLDDPAQPVKLNLKYSGPSYLKKAGALAILQLPGAGYSAAGVARENRTYPIVFTSTSMSEININIKIPAAYKVRYVPEEIQLDLPYISYRAKYTVQGDVIAYTEVSTVRQTEIPTSAYAEYKQFQERIAQNAERPIILEEKSPSQVDGAQTAMQ